MPRFHGVAWAIRDKDPVLEATRLSGEHKDEIYIDETWRQPIDVHHPESVREAFDRMLELVTQAARLQQQGGSKCPIPIAHGWPKGFETDHLSALNASLAQAYGGPVESNARNQVGILMVRAVAQDPLLRTATIHPNGRYFTQEGNVQAAEKLDPQAEAVLEGLFQSVEAGVPGAGNIAMELMRVRAKSFALLHKQLIGHQRTTFFSTAPAREPFLSSHVYNFPGYHDTLRQEFARVLIAELGLNRNISVKVPQDPVSAAFADPAAAETADQMDLFFYGEIRPSAVLAKHR